MSGRIRTIKPELLEDEKTASLSSDQWRLFVSLFLLADDYGNLHGEARRIEAAVFWGYQPSSSTTDLLSVLEDVGLITRYVVSGQSYVSISGWSKHQKVQHPGKPRVPQPPKQRASRESHEDYRDPPETLSRISGVLPSYGNHYVHETLTRVSGVSHETLTPDLRSPTTTSDPDLARARARDPEPESDDLAAKVHTRFRKLYLAAKSADPSMGGRNVGGFAERLATTAKARSADPLELLERAFARWARGGFEGSDKASPYSAFVARFERLLETPSAAPSGLDPAKRVVSRPTSKPDAAILALEPEKRCTLPGRGDEPAERLTAPATGGKP